jgi:hypothetical protein
MSHHPANTLFHALKQATASPLEQLEAEARASKWHSAEQGSLYVLARKDGSFSYEWGDVMISRREAALRAEGRAS